MSFFLKAHPPAVTGGMMGGGCGSHAFRYGWGLDGMGTPMEPSFIENTTMHDHMNRRKIFGKPANGRMVGYVTRMQKRRPPYFSMKCLPCRDNFPKCFFDGAFSLWCFLASKCVSFLCIDIFSLNISFVSTFRLSIIFRMGIFSLKFFGATKMAH